MERNSSEFKKRYKEFNCEVEMICSKKDLEDYLLIEKRLYQEIGYKGRLHSFITQCEVGKIYQYIVSLRKDEYFSNIENLNLIKKGFAV